MSALLRSGKLLRCANGFMRNVAAVRTGYVNGRLQITSSNMCLNLQRNASGGVNTSKSEYNLERYMRRLDNNIRRVGRISRRDLMEVIGEIRTNRSATSSQSLMIIRCCGGLVSEEKPEVRTSLVQEIWKIFNAINVPLDISHYNALLRVYLENEHEFSPTDFLAEIESKSIEPNHVTYHRLIERYCHMGDIEGATKILEFMKEKNLPVNEKVFNALIVGHSQANDMISAKGILTVMNQAGVEPSSETYATLLSCYAKHGDMESIANTLVECEHKEIPLLDKDLLNIAYQLIINGHGDQIDSILGKLHISMSFNQDCINVILRLTNKGYEDACLKLLRLMPRGNKPSGDPVDVGIFFVKQLVNANRPTEKIISICKTLESEGLNPKALLVAVEEGLNLGSLHRTLPLLREMQNQGLPIRQHYFWPFICAAKPEEIKEILRVMQNEFDLTATGETLRDYVIPHLPEKQSDALINVLRNIGIPIGTAAAAVCHRALMQHNIQDAAHIMERHRFYYNLQILRNPIVQALDKSNDYDAFVRCLRQIHEGIQRRYTSQVDAMEKAEELEEEQESSVDVSNDVSSVDTVGKASPPDVVGEILLDICSYYRNKRVEVMETLLPLLVKQGFTIHSRFAERLTDRLGSEMTTQISELLGKLSSGELKLIPLPSSKRSLGELSIEELERFIARIEAKGDDSKNIKRQLLTTCFQSNNLEKAAEVVERLKSENYVFSSGVQAQLLALYASHERTNEALSIYNNIKVEEPNFLLDNIKTVSLAYLLINENRLDEALKLLEENKKATLEDENNYNYTSRVWRLMNALADKGDEDNLQKLFNTLIACNYIIPTNILLGPLIKVHLVKNDIAKAIETFEKICLEYKVTPWKNELTRRLIETEDAVNLQRITDLSTEIHGEMNSLYDLVFSFVECGRIRQARKILETPGLRVRPHRIDNACERYKNDGMTKSLEGLIEATKDLHNIDRNKIYYTLLLSYSASNDAEKAVGLWTKMQEENIVPNDLFLIKLAELLNKNGMPVPFAVPVIDQSAGIDMESATKSGKYAQGDKVQATNNRTDLFMQALRNGNLDEAIHLKNLNDSNPLPIISISRLIEKLVNENRFNEATKCVVELLEQNLYPTPRIFRYYLNRIVDIGSLKTLQMIGELLNDEQKRLASFDNRLCQLYVNSDRVGEYVQKLRDEISAVQNPEEANKLVNKFPRGGAIAILKTGKFLPEFIEIAEMYAKHNQLAPMNVLWNYYIINGDMEKAKDVWSKYLSNESRLMFKSVLKAARDQGSSALIENLISQLMESKLSDAAIGIAYSGLLDVHLLNNNTDKAMEALQVALKRVCLENINRSSLTRLKSSCKALNREFPYSIPKNASNASSSSSSDASSDDDVTPPKPETLPTKPHH